ncbi:MAG: hypothetical protein ACPGVT_13560 [Maricaulaceae bacterium]
MFVDSSSTPRTRGRAIQGAIIMLILILCSTLSFKIAGQNLVFTAIPAIGVFLWPRGADPFLSVLSLFILGVIHDTVSFGIIGFWALIYLLYFIIFRPDGRSREDGFLNRWGKFWLLIIFGGALMALLGVMFMKTGSDLKSLFIMQLVAAVLFPLIYFLGLIYKRIFGEYDDGGYNL